MAGGKSSRSAVSMRNKLAAIVLITLFPAVMLNLFWAVGRANAIRSAAEKEVQALTEHIARDLAAHISSLLADERALSISFLQSRHGIENRSKPCSLERSIAAYPMISRLSVYDTAGTVLACMTSPILDQKLTEDCPDPVLIIEYLSESGGQAAFITMQQGTVLPTIICATLIESADLIAGAVVAEIDPASVFAIFGGLVDVNDSITLSDGHSVALRTGGADYSDLKAHEPTAPERMSTVVATAEVPELNWTVAVKRRIEPGLYPVKDMLFRDLSITAMGACIGLLSALMASSALDRDIDEVRRAAMAILEGDLWARTGYAHTEEMAATRKAFDDMADSILDLERERLKVMELTWHELRNPLAALRGAASLLKLRMESEGNNCDEGIRDLALIVDRNTQALASKLTAIMDAWTMSVGSRVTEKHDVSLTQVVRERLEPYIAGEHGHRFIVTGLEHQDPEVMVYGDANGLSQVVDELLSNALKYSLGHGEIGVSLSRECGFAHLTVWDCGIGIPASELEEVFKSYFRGSNVEEHDPGGLGLGLFNSGMIVRLHDGRIWAESEPGGGAVFQVLLPIPATPHLALKERRHIRASNSRG